MAVVDHRNRIVAVGEIADVIEIRDRAVHRKDAIGHNQLFPTVGGVFQVGLQAVHVIVLIAKSLRLGEADTVNNAGVIQSIANDSILFVENRLKQAAVCVEAGWIENRVFGAQELANPLLELFVNRLRAADKAHGRHTVAIFVKCFVGSGNYLRVVREPEIVICAQVQNLYGSAIITNLDGGLLWTCYQSFFLVQALGLQCFSLAGQRLQKICGHGIALRFERPQSISGPSEFKAAK